MGGLRRTVNRDIGVQGVPRRSQIAVPRFRCRRRKRNLRKSSSRTDGGPKPTVCVVDRSVHPRPASIAALGQRHQPQRRLARRRTRSGKVGSPTILGASDAVAADGSIAMRRLYFVLPHIGRLFVVDRLCRHHPRELRLVRHVVQVRFDFGQLTPERVDQRLPFHLRLKPPHCEFP